MITGEWAVRSRGQIETGGLISQPGCVAHLAQTAAEQVAAQPEQTLDGAANRF